MSCSAAGQLDKKKSELKAQNSRRELLKTAFWVTFKQPIADGIYVSLPIKSACNSARASKPPLSQGSSYTEKIPVNVRMNVCSTEVI